MNGDEEGDGAVTGRGRGWRQMNERKMGTETGVGTGRGRERERGWRPVDEHRMGTGTGAGTETRAVAEVGMWTRVGTRTGSGRAEERRRSARSRSRGVDAICETGETWVEREKHVKKKGLDQ